MKAVRVGCSGWNYDHWRNGVFYPPRCPPRLWLEYYARHFETVEVNATFYRLPKRDVVANWVETSPPAFQFAVKMSRYITHLKRLQGLDAGVRSFYERIEPLVRSPKLGPVLWQLPETLRFDAAGLDDFLGRLPHGTREMATLATHHDDKLAGDRALTTAEADLPVRHALEFRSPTFATQEAYDVLRRHDVATVYADTAGRWPKVDEDTASYRYVRLHGDQELYASGYTDRALDDWAARCSGWAASGQDVFVYFDNDMKGYAPHDAMRLIARLAAAS